MTAGPVGAPGAVRVRPAAGRSRVPVAGLAAAAGSVALWVVWVCRHPARLWSMIDLRVLDWGGQMVQHRPSALYDGRFDHLLPFLYPPFAALGYATLDVLPFNGLQTLESVVVIGSTFALVWLSLGMAARSRSRPMQWRTRLAATGAVGAAALWLEPVQQTLAFGQVSVLLTLLVVADLALDDRRWFKGALIGIGTGLKLTPGLFIVYLVLTRRFRAAAVSTGSLLATAAVGFLVLPAQSRQFWTPAVLESLSTRIDGSDLQNQSIDGTLLRLLPPGPAHLAWLAAAAVVTAIGLGLAVGLFRRYGDLAGMPATALVGLLVSPISWTHYWIWVLPPLVWGGYHAITRRRAWTGLAVAAIGALFLAYPMRLDPATGRWDRRFELLPRGLVWTAPQADRLEHDWVGWELVRGNLYVIFGVAVLVVAAAWFARIGRRTSHTATSVEPSAVTLRARPDTGEPGWKRPRKATQEQPIPPLGAHVLRRTAVTHDER